MIIVMCVVPDKTIAGKVLSSYFRATPNLIFIPPFYRFSLPLVLFFPIAPGSRQETRFILAKNASRKQKQGIFLTTVIRELINYELTFFPDAQLRGTCASK